LFSLVSVGKDITLTLQRKKEFHLGFEGNLTRRGTRLPLLHALSNDKDSNVKLSATKALKEIGEEGHNFNSE